MSGARTPNSKSAGLLRTAVTLGPEKVLNWAGAASQLRVHREAPTMILLAAGKGTRFGQEPKCAQLVNGVPLARHSMDAFARFSPSSIICLVGYRHEQVAAALGSDAIYVRSENPAGGTAFAAYEAFSIEALDAQNPVVILTMGDRIVPLSIFRRLYETHVGDSQEAVLTLLTAVYEPPKNRGKGRILRDAGHRLLGIIEQNDINAIPDERVRQSLDELTEGNCPLYAIRAQDLRRHLESLSNDNAQNQYYLTDLIERVRHSGGEIRTITTTVAEPEYDLLCSDVTEPMDLALLEGVLKSGTTRALGRVPTMRRQLK